MPEAGELLKLPSHEKICGNPMRRNGIKAVSYTHLEPPVEIENSEATTEADAETSTESAYWFIPQSSDCLISDEEKEQLPLFIGKVSCRLII